MKTPEVEIRVTGDGSPTLYRADLEEGYHSRHGAIQESVHVFIEAGLNYWLNLHPEATEVRVFEAGFGTGLNALLAWEWAQEKKIRVFYTTVEQYPLQEQVWSRLAYAAGEPQWFSDLHQVPWGEEIRLDPFFVLLKISGDLSTLIFDKQYDVIFYDAFAPEKQSELWTEEIFMNMYSMQSPGGVLVTYCAKGQVRRNMLNAGYGVSRIPGPPGKRQMLRATRSLQ